MSSLKIKNLIFKMCGQGDTQNTPKYFCGCFLVMLVVIIGLAVYISVMGNSGASVQMTGENDSAEIKESSGFHIIEVNGSDIGSGNVREWSYMEIGFIVLGFIFFLNMTHIFHYCVFTKKLVKRKVKKYTDLELGKLTKAPSNDVVILPGLV